MSDTLKSRLELRMAQLSVLMADVGEDIRIAFSSQQQEAGGELCRAVDTLDLTRVRLKTACRHAKY